MIEAGEDSSAALHQQMLQPRRGTGVHPLPDLTTPLQAAENQDNAIRSPPQVCSPTPLLFCTPPGTEAGHEQACITLNERV